MRGRFLVVEGGMNDIALWNTHFQRYLKITGSGAVWMPETVAVLLVESRR